MNRPHATVGVLITEGDKVLLFKSHKWNGWIVCGGKIDAGETVVDAVHREVMEETGLTVKNPHFLGYQDSVHAKDFHEEKHFIFFDFVAEKNSEDMTLNSELQEHGWFTIEEALKLKLGSGTKKLLERYVEWKHEA